MAKSFYQRQKSLSRFRVGENSKEKTANRIIQRIKTRRAPFWEKVRSKQMLNLFRLASRQVPAYQDFLRKHKVKSGNIKTVVDLQSLPTIDKKNYLRRYPLSELTVGGRLDKPLVFTSTSGSTGVPFYFHRSFDLDLQTSVIHELFYLYGQYKKHEKFGEDIKTLNL